jgi:hypothetical protein
MITSIRVLVAVGATLAALGPAGPAHAAHGSLECFAEVPGVTPRGVPTTFTYDDGRATSENRGPDDLGYQPRDVAYPHDVGGGADRAGRTAPVTSHWFTLSGDQLREVTEVDIRDRRGVLIAAEYRTRVVRRHWEGVRQISIGRDRDHLYVLTNTDQLLQYRISGQDGSTTVKLAATVGTGFGTIGTLEYARTVTTGDGARSDVFLTTDADTGALVELTIPVDAPTTYSRTVLATEGWLEMRSAGRTASCINARSGRSYDGIVGVDVDGQVLLWTDRDAKDGSGEDIVARGVLKSDWKPMAYSD